MLNIKDLPDGRKEVRSDKGMVDIGEGPVKAIICMAEEVEMIEEVIT